MVWRGPGENSRLRWPDKPKEALQLIWQGETAMAQDVMRRLWCCGPSEDDGYYEVMSAYLGYHSKDKCGCFLRHIVKTGHKMH